MDDIHPSPSEDLHSEQGRLSTFRCWPHSAAVSPPQLADAGFYYLGPADRVRCAFCGGTLRSWECGDDPWTEHRKHYRQCRFVQGQDVGNIPLPSSQSGSRSSVPGAPNEQAGVLPGLDIGPEVVPASLMLNPRNCTYQSLDSRRETFVSWPSHLAQQPETLVQAGFFYTGDGDAVRCFCCDGALRNWESNDDPWEEHARWFPRCPYLIQQKGQGYIQDIKSRFTRLQQHKACQKASPLMPRRVASPEPPMSSLVKKAQEMGFEPSLIHRTLQEIMSSSGGHLPSEEQLINTLLNGITPPRPGSGQGSGEQSARSSREEHSQGPGESGVSDRTLCKVCMEREVAVVFMPCGHLVCCSECAKSIRLCPMCRQGIRASIRTYLC